MGETIYKGHRSYDLMLNLQLGIRHSVQAVARELPQQRLADEHFRQKVFPANALLLLSLLCAASRQLQHMRLLPQDWRASLVGSKVA